MTNREQAIKNLLTRNVEEVIQKNHLEKELKSGKKLRVKLGIDPTSPDLHLGHAVVLRKLKEFQDLEHKIVLIIGDFTGRIGDPSGRETARKPLTLAEIKKNMKEYLAQAGKIIDVKKAEIRHNSEWFRTKGVEKILELAKATSIRQLLHRADFQKRLSRNEDISALEVLYPAFQGYDSVNIKADVELGGTDQTFNLLMGRRVQRHFKMKEQDILTVPLLEGTDGVKKMSKSVGNYIGLTESANQMFGKVMSIPDKLVPRYFMLGTDLEEGEIKELGEKLSPRDLKARLGYEIVKLCHGKQAAEKAADQWDKLFSKRKEAAIDLPPLKLSGKSLFPVDLVLRSGFTKSKSEARRLIEQGGVSIDGRDVKNPKNPIGFRGGEIVKIGKRHFFRVK